MAIRNQEALDERARNLQGQGLNGFKQVLVTLHPAGKPTQARLEIHFYNANEVANIVHDFTTAASAILAEGLAKQIFPISGGHRITAGPAADQVKVEAIAQGPTPSSLALTVTPIGDYSTYTLRINYQNIDPLFNEIAFKFRPGCFNLCAPDWTPAPQPKEDPAIDYLAKDFESFRHTMITAMRQRLSGWQPTSEADLDQVLLELFSAAADELSDYQDRVMNEAYLGTVRKRVSLARHARLMDYHIHQGNQARTWLALRTFDGATFDLLKGFRVSTNNLDNPSAIVFMTRKTHHLHHLLNEMGLYTWSDAIPALAAGSTAADLKIDGTEASAKIVEALIRNRKVTHLLIQEHLNPSTGEAVGRDATRRQLLRLLPDKTVALRDPVTTQWLVQVEWAEEDKLKRPYCFTINCPPPTGKVEDVSRFHGNLVQVYHGLSQNDVFKNEGVLLSNSNEFHYEETKAWGAICRLSSGPLAYKETPPGGEVPPESTLEVEVDIPGGGRDNWNEVISLVRSNEQSDHFVVETDELGQSLMRFGNGTNGKELPENATIYCAYQIGRGLDGNIGADTLSHFDRVTVPEIGACWNPFDVTNGRDPEPWDEMIRRVPEAYRFRQLRAVTLKDYVERAEELPTVAKAAARYVWTGSWRAVQIAIDPVGTTELPDALRQEIARYLDAVRLIGDDIEIRPPRFVPLDITVKLCLHPDFWPEDIRFVLEQEFSDGFTPDGKKGFFHPDLWTFGQELRASQIIGRVQSVRGVDHVIDVLMKRWNEVTPGTPGVIEVRTNEIIQVKNDRDHLEAGFIFFDIRGGRQ